MNQIAIVSGMVLSYLANRMIVGHGDPAWMISIGWRWMLGMALAPSLLFLILTFWVPESPRWLAKRGRNPEARLILGRILMASEAEAEFDSILKSLREEEGRMRELFLPGGRRITYMSMVLALFQAITGINIVMYYAPRIFLNAGIGTGDAYGHSIIIGLVMIFFTLIALLIVDRIGRRPIMIAASAGMGASLFLMGIAFPKAEQSGLLLLICTLSYVSWFSVGMGGIYWVVVSEIFPNRVRGRAMALSVVFLWGGNFLVAQFFPYMLSALHSSVFNVFAFCCLLCLVFVVAFVPETKGRTLEAIEREFRAVSPFKVKPAENARGHEIGYLYGRRSRELWAGPASSRHRRGLGLRTRPDRGPDRSLRRFAHLALVRFPPAFHGRTSPARTSLVGVLASSNGRA